MGGDLRGLRWSGARLQLNLAATAVMTAFDEWDNSQPFEAFIDTAARYLEQMGQAFTPGDPL